MKKFSGLKLENGDDIFTNEYIKKLREEEDNRPDKNHRLKFIAQEGGQERMLSIDADIKIVGGNRGGAKSFSLLMEALKNIKIPKFSAVLLRNEKPDLDGLIKDSPDLYSQYGSYNKSINDMTWNFFAGGSLKFSYYGDDIEDFKTRFRGKQYAYIGIDEVTQCPFEKFKFIITTNRNSSNIRNRLWGTCNPDPDSWVAKFIDWWIDDEGYPIPERDGVLRYCFMNGDTVDEIYWGDTPEEVYEQCKEIIDPLWSDAYEELGYNKISMFIKSVTYIRAKVEQNKELLSSSPEYISNLAGQSEEQRARDLGGNWKYKQAGDDMIKIDDLEAFFNNPYQIQTEVRHASCDIAFTGGDNLVMWLMVGSHIKDLYVCRYDSRVAIATVKEKLIEWGVEEKNFTYDLNGLGQSFKGFFPDAIPFNNMAAPIAMNIEDEKGIKYLYHDLKSQCAYMFYKDIKDLTLSIEKDLLNIKYSGNGFKDTMLRDILMKERKCIRRKENSQDKGFWLLSKEIAKKYVGHSPDFIESLIYMQIFKINKKHKKAKGLWRI